MKNIVVFALIACLFAGCASSGRKLDQTQVNQIQKGVTTRDQVIASIGSPDQITRLGNGDTMFQYSYMRATTKPETFIPIVGAFAGGANVQNQMVMVTFGPDNIVKDIMSTYGATETNLGATTGSKASLDDVETNKRAK